MSGNNERRTTIWPFPVFSASNCNEFFSESGDGLRQRVKAMNGDDSN